MKMVIIVKAWDLIIGTKHFGLKVEGCTANEPQRIVDALSKGKLIIAIMSKGHFIRYGHFIVLRGVTVNKKILVADSVSRRRSEEKWDLSIILNEANKGADVGIEVNVAITIAG